MDWADPTPAQELVFGNAVTALVTMLDPYLALLPRGPHLQAAAPLILRTAAFLCCAVNRTCDAWRGRRPTQQQRDSGLLGVLPRLAMRVALPLVVVQQASPGSPAIDEDGDARPRRAPPGAAEPAQRGLAAALEVGEVLPVVEGAVRYLGKAEEVLRLGPVAAGLEGELRARMGLALGVLAALVGDIRSSLAGEGQAGPAGQAGEARREAAARHLPALKSLLASTVKLSHEASKARGGETLLPPQRVARVASLLVDVTDCVAEAILLQAGARAPLPPWQGQGDILPQQRLR
jgi:hypothetical protein